MPLWMTDEFVEDLPTTEGGREGTLRLRPTEPGLPAPKDMKGHHLTVNRNGWPETTYLVTDVTDPDEFGRVTLTLAEG